jgi:hypothetical protein
MSFKLVIPGVEMPIEPIVLIKDSKKMLILPTKNGYTLIACVTYDTPTSQLWIKARENLYKLVL